jgi:hypothetical protein
MMAKQWVRHESFNSAQRTYDIAVVQLPADVYYSKNTAIANLYLKDPEILTSFYVDQFATVAGWGQTGQTAAVSRDVKQLLRFPCIQWETEQETRSVSHCIQGKRKSCLTSLAVSPTLKYTTVKLIDIAVCRLTYYLISSQIFSVSGNTTRFQVT